MERSSEIEGVVQTVFDAMAAGDAATVQAMLSADLTASIGTDDAEWWDGFDSTAAAVGAQLEASGGLPLRSGGTRGYAVEDFGWFEDHGSVDIEGGEAVPVRVTGVLRREDGTWRLLQLHASVGTPNADMGMADLPV